MPGDSFSDLIIPRVLSQKRGGGGEAWCKKCLASSSISHEPGREREDENFQFVQQLLSHIVKSKGKVKKLGGEKKKKTKR